MADKLVGNRVSIWNHQGENEQDTGGHPRLSPYGNIWKPFLYKKGVDKGGAV